MIKLGHVADIDTFTVPDCIKSDVFSILTTLDKCYGANRDINSDMGGFVVICDNSDILNIPHFDITTEVAEYSETIGNYEKSLFISGTERNIVIYRKTE